MDRKQVMKMFNKETRVGILATANNHKDVNAAVFGSPRMIDEDTVIMAIGDNRSAQYLEENPNAIQAAIRFKITDVRPLIAPSA